MTKTITLTIPHNLDPDEVKRRITTAISDARSKHAEVFKNATENWTGNELRFSVQAMGSTITGSVEIERELVRLSVDLPMMLAMFAGKFTPMIESEGRKLLESPQKK